MRKLFAGLMAASALAAAAQAAPNLEASIAQCAAKSDAKERLACYDAIAHGLVSSAPAVTPSPMATAPAPAIATPAPAAAAPAPAVAAAPPAAASQQTEAQFGAEMLKKESREAAGQPEPLEAIHGTIAKLAFSPTGRAIVSLENGQVWRQVEGDTEPFKGRQGETATIERAILGSYSLTIEGRNQLIKVKRVR